MEKIRQFGAMNEPSGGCEDGHADPNAQGETQQDGLLRNKVWLDKSDRQS